MLTCTLNCPVHLVSMTLSIWHQSVLMSVKHDILFVYSWNLSHWIIIWNLSNIGKDETSITEAICLAIAPIVSVPMVLLTATNVRIPWYIVRCKRSFHVVHLVSIILVKTQHCHKWGDGMPFLCVPICSSSWTNDQTLIWWLLQRCGECWLHAQLLCRCCKL